MVVAGVGVAVGCATFCAPAPAQTAADRVHQVVVRYDRAFAAGHYRVACSLLTPTARRNVASFGPGGCQRQLLRATGFDRASARAFANAGVDTPNVRGNVADVIITPSGLPTNGTRLHRLKGRWLIALPPSTITGTG